jgi:uncharacterized phage protein (TIGR01671 family)
MKREIKFRAWDKSTKEMWTPYQPVQFEEDSNWLWADVNSENNKFHLMQYTGLKDKNGKEIYEGDLLDNGSDRICKVEWHNYTGSWDFTPVNDLGTSNFFRAEHTHRALEVIGNIYEKAETPNS